MELERYKALSAEFAALRDRWKNSSDRDERFDLLTEICDTTDKMQVLLTDLSEELQRSR